MPYSIRDHLRHANKEINRFQRKVGTSVLWWEFDKAGTTKDDLYDEGSATGHREWVAPKRIPVYSVIRQEGIETPNPEGQYTVDSIHLSGQLEKMRQAGLSEPYNSQRHINDRFVYDGFVWEVRRYQIFGRLWDYETTVGIDATKVSPEEMINDPQFQAYT